MSLACMSATSFGGTGWLALALLASEIWSLLQPASTTPVARTSEVAKRANQRPIDQRKAPQPMGELPAEFRTTVPVAVINY